MLNDQDSNLVANAALEHMDYLFSRIIPRVIKNAIEYAVRQNISEICKSIENGIDTSLSSGTEISDAFRIGVENALSDINNK